MMKKMFLDVLDCEHPPSSEQNWIKSSSRALACFVVKILAQAQSCCVDPPEVTITVEKPSYLLSYDFFVDQLAETMTKFRRNNGDDSPAIIWDTTPSKRYSTNWGRDEWRCKPLILSFNQNALPRSSTATAPPRLNFPHLEIATLSNKFPTISSAKQRSPLRMLCLKFLYFYKLVYERKTGEQVDTVKAFDDDIMNFRITDTLYLHHFFYGMLNYQEFIKNTYNFCKLINPNLNVSGNDNKTKIIALIKYGEDQWDLSGNGHDSMFNYSDKDESEMDNYIDTGDIKEATKYAVKDGIFTRNYVVKLHEEFEKFVAGVKVKFRNDRSSLASTIGRGVEIKKRKRDSM